MSDRMEKIVELLGEMAQAQKNLSRVSENLGTVDIAIAGHALGIERFRLIALKKQVSLVAAEIRTRLEQLCLAEGADADFPKGVSVITQEVLSYPERNAILYCGRNYPKALSLRKRDFETMARACLPFVPDLDEIVHLRQQSSLRLARDLSAYLADDEGSSPE